MLTRSDISMIMLLNAQWPTVKNSQRKQKNWGQFKDPDSNMCLTDVLVAPWYFTQEMAGSSPFTVMTDIAANSVKHLGTTIMFRSL